MNRTMLQLLRIVVAHPVRLRELAAEQRRKVLDADSILSRRRHAFSLSCDHIGGKLGAFSLQNIGDRNAERNCALMYKGKRKIKLPRLIASVLFDGDVGFFRHLLLIKSRYKPHLSNTCGNLHQLSRHGFGFCFHFLIPPFPASIPRSALSWQSKFEIRTGGRP